MSPMRRISYMLILCLSILFVQAKDFRFALFTDLHITHSTPAVEDLQRAVDQVNATSGIDFANDLHSGILRTKSNNLFARAV